ncbi:unnamed protein product, partial [Amoebophrya sp. A25]
RDGNAGGFPSSTSSSQPSSTSSDRSNDVHLSHRPRLSLIERVADRKGASLLDIIASRISKFRPGTTVGRTSVDDMGSLLRCHELLRVRGVIATTETSAPEDLQRLGIPGDLRRFHVESEPMAGIDWEAVSFAPFC